MKFQIGGTGIVATTLKELAVKRSDIFFVPPQSLRVKEGLNARVADDPENKAHIEELAISIAEVGVMEPLTCFRIGDEIYVSDGHCRLAATLIAIKRGAEIKAIPVKTDERGTGEADRLLRQVLSGKAKTPFEQGIIYKRLIGFGWTIATIAAKSGKSISHVNAALDLQEAPVEAQNLVTSGKVSASLAGKVIRERGAKEGTATLQEAVATAESVGKTRATAKHVAASEPPPTLAVRDPEAIERLLKHLIRAARAGDERLVKWLAEANVSLD
jgi:ParB-like chromosome segregation protein Spo0J